MATSTARPNSTVDRHGRTISRASRRVADDETLMPIVVPDRVHEGLCTIAFRRGTTVDGLVATVLERLATDLG